MTMVNPLKIDKLLFTSGLGQNRQYFFYTKTNKRELKQDCQIKIVSFQKYPYIKKKSRIEK